MAGAVRRAARRWIPRRVRAEVAHAGRRIRDRRRAVRFAEGRASVDAFPHAFRAYRLPLIVYPGQEQQAAGKRRNQEVMAAALHGARVDPGEVLSLWRTVGRPTARRGYLPGAAIVEGRLIVEVGGATCLFSTVLYNAGLLAGLEVVERHPHSVDSYGEARYFELGRDATIEYGVLDLRLRNAYDFPVLLEVGVDGDGVAAGFRAPVAELPSIEVSTEIAPGEGSWRAARTLRSVTTADGRRRDEDLGWSRYRVADARYLATGPAPKGTM